MVDGLAEIDLATLDAAAAWVVADAVQAHDVGHRFEVPVEELGAVIDPAALPRAADPRPGRGVVVVVSSADAWNAADPAVEVLWQLRRSRPGAPLRWLVADDRALWLAHHDLDHADLSGVEVATIDDPGALDRAGLVVRTADEPVGEALLVAATLAGVPVIDHHGGYGRPEDVGGTPGVEVTVDSVARLRDDVERAVRQGREGADGLAHLDLEARAAAGLDLLLP